MRHLVVVVTAVAVAVLSGASYAQTDNRPSAEQRKLRRLAGNWTWTGEQVDIDSESSPFGKAGKFAGKATSRIMLNGLFLRQVWEENGPGGRLQGRTITSYDEEKRAYVGHDFMGDGTISTATFTIDGRVLTSNITYPAKAGEKLLARVVEKFSPDWNSSEAIWEASVDNGKTWKHWAKMASKKSKRKGVTREDFEEFCKLLGGAWVGVVPFRADVPGLGKKGEKATAHYETTIIEGGAALIGKFYWPWGTHTAVYTYDETTKQIKSTGISATRGIDYPTVYCSNRTWTIEGSDTLADGTKSEWTARGTYSDDGDTLTVAVTITEGSEITELTDVWQRMNK